jgi:hypothetical protein
MGGGRRLRGGAKAVTADYLELDVRLLARDNVLTPGYKGNVHWTQGAEVVASIRVETEIDRVVLTYRLRDSSNASCPVTIVRTLCAFAGSRPWFLCPAPGCGRRVAILYGATSFACRDCHRLAYPSCREDVGDRLLRRANRIRARLRWPPGILNPPGTRPRWMHRTTYRRLTSELDDLANRTMCS